MFLITVQYITKWFASMSTPLVLDGYCQKIISLQHVIKKSTMCLINRFLNSNLLLYFYLNAISPWLPVQNISKFASMSSPIVLQDV